MKKETARQKRIGELMHQFVYVNRLYRVLTEEQIGKLGIHYSQHHMLVLIAGNKSICQKDIAKKLNISSAAVAVTLGKLETAGLITRSQSFEDARMNHIAITDKGVDLLKSSKSMFDGIDAELFNDISDEELEQLSAIISKVVANGRGTDGK